MLQKATSSKNHNAQIKSLEKRKGQMAIPLNLGDYLNQDQLDSLKHMENFGWNLSFIRRATGRPIEAIVVSSDKQSYGVLESDGSINTHTNLYVRH